jgi:hypothetical protein
MSLQDIYTVFPIEAYSCKTFREDREKECGACKKCQNTLHYWKHGKECFEFKKFHFRTTLRSSAVAKSSRLSFHHSFIAIHLSTSSKMNFCAKAIQRQLNRRHYELEQANRLLQLVPIAISNTKQLLLYLHHIVDVDFLKNYLKECFWKYSQGYLNNPLFYRLLVCTVSYRREYLGYAKINSFL